MPLARHGVTLELWQAQDVGHEMLGEIKDGVPDRDVRIGLLGEWEGTLARAR